MKSLMGLTKDTFGDFARAFRHSEYRGAELLSLEKPEGMKKAHSGSHKTHPDGRAQIPKLNNYYYSVVTVSHSVTYPHTFL